MATTQEKIEIILNEEKRAYAAKGRTVGGLGSFNHGLPTRVAMSESPPELVAAKSDPDAIQSPNADLLLKLHSSLDSSDKRLFETVLLIEMRADGNYAKISYLNLFVLYKLGLLNLAIEQASKVLGDSTDFDNVTAMMALIITYEYSFLTEKEYQHLDIFWNRTNSYKYWLKDRINSGKFKLLAQQLSDVNPEINADKQKLLNLWEQRFGKGPITELIKEIDEFFNEGEFSPTKYAACIGRVRVLLVEIFRTIARAISSETKDGKITGSATEHFILDYLRDRTFLTDDEWGMAKTLYGLTSDRGVHQIIAPREYARIAKNIAYEISLLALTKFKSSKNIN